MIQKYLNNNNINIEQEKQIIPIAVTDSAALNKVPIQQNSMGSARKLSIVDFQTDQLRNFFINNESGAKFIKIREDIVPDLNFIKKELNNFGIPLSCQSFNISIDNKFVSHLGRVGLEIHLNPNAAMNSTKNPEYSDYYISPDPAIPNKLRIYGEAKKQFTFETFTYYPTKQVLDVYDIRQTYGKYPPKTVKVFKNCLDITKIFEDRGFIQKQPEKDFFFKSDNIKSNWYVFFKPSKINIGYTYNELLSTVYDNNGETIWLDTKLSWDGKSFK